MILDSSFCTFSLYCLKPAKFAVLCIPTFARQPDFKLEIGLPPLEFDLFSHS